MVRVHARISRTGVALALALIGAAPAVAVTPVAQAFPASASGTPASAPFSWQNQQWCPSYHSYNGCDSIQNPSQYSVSFSPAQVSESSRSGVQLTMNRSATSSGAINTWGKETFNSPATFAATITLQCNSHGQILNWPAFWTVGTVGSWPADGEIDILEGQGGHATWSYHYVDASGNNAVQTGTPSGNWCGTHAYSASWQGSSITFTWDGRQVGQVTSNEIGVPIVSDQMYVIFDYGASPTYGGPTAAGASMGVLSFAAN
jgi:hypothetical protein